RPTANSEASMDVCGHVAMSSSQWGFFARAMALSGVASRQPKPSRMTSATGRRARRMASDIEAWEWDATLSAIRVSYHFTFAPPSSNSEVMSLTFIEHNWYLVLALVVSGALLVWPLLQR